MSTRQIVNLRPSATVWEAACVMTTANCGSGVILEATGEALGIVTERDLMTPVLAKALDPKTTRVAEVMTVNPHVVTPDTTVSQAVLIMIERGFRRLPVAGADGAILGVFSARDALPREIDAAMSMAQSTSPRFQ